MDSNKNNWGYQKRLEKLKTKYIAASCIRSLKHKALNRKTGEIQIKSGV